MNFDKTTTAETPLIRIVDDEGACGNRSLSCSSMKGSNAASIRLPSPFSKGIRLLGRDVCCSMFRWTA